MLSRRSDDEQPLICQRLEQRLHSVARRSGRHQIVEWYTPARIRGALAGLDETQEQTAQVVLLSGSVALGQDGVGAGGERALDAAKGTVGFPTQRTVGLALLPELL